MPNSERAATVSERCSCDGFNTNCPRCKGLRQVIFRACKRCGGTGQDGAKCPDCRGRGWRDIDQSEAFEG